MGMGTEWGQDEDEDTDGDRMVTLYLERDEVWGQGRLCSSLCWAGGRCPLLCVRVSAPCPPRLVATQVSCVPPGAMQVSCPPLGTRRCHAGWESRGWGAGQARAMLCHAVPCQITPCHAVPHRAVPCRQAGSPYCWGSGASTFLAAFSPNSGELEQGPAGK